MYGSTPTVLGHGLKICILFGHKPHISFVTFSQKEFSHICVAEGIFCMHLLLQFSSDSFETLQVFRSWSADVHIVWA